MRFVRGILRLAAALTIGVCCVWVQDFPVVPVENGASRILFHGKPNSDQSDQGRQILMDAQAFHVYRVRLYPHARPQARQ